GGSARRARAGRLALTHGRRGRRRVRRHRRAPGTGLAVRPPRGAARPARAGDRARGGLADAAAARGPAPGGARRRDGRCDRAGARIQVHRADGEVAIFTRTLDDVTARLPEVVEAALALPARAVVFDGEAIALREDGRPQPFQVTASRFGSRERREVPLSPFLFDVLHLDGEDLLDRPGAERFDALAAVVPEALRVPRATAADAAAAADVLADALARGHEGVMVKALDAPYEAGRRGSAWLK